jgi:hypothetical protein
MTKAEFLILLNGASYISYKFAKNYVKDKLVPEFKFDVLLNQSSDDPSLKQYDMYPEDDGKLIESISDKEVVELLFRNGKVPVWIDVAVLNAEKNHTVLRLLCAGRYSENKEEYYYNSGGTGPFGIKGPNLPIGYIEGKKFKLKKRKPNTS